MPERLSEWSLRGRLLWIAAIALLASLAFGGLAMYWAASIEEDQMMDARLEHLGATVLAFVEEEIEEELEEIREGKHTMPLNLKTRPSVALLYRFQVWTRHGSLLMRSHEAPSDQPLMPLTKFGFDTLRLQGEQYRTFAVPTNNREFVVQVAENIEERWAQTASATLYYVGFLLIPLSLVFGATWVWLRRSLLSIDTLAAQLSERKPLDLAPVTVERPPRELLPILKAVDALLTRVGHALSVERGFTAVAAHEMRTPLAGLRAHAQLATKAGSDHELRQALDSLMVGADRASHLIDQLLDLARVETTPKDAASQLEPIELSDVYQDLMADIGPRGVKKEIVFAARFGVERLVAHRFALQVLMRNLLANAIAYTPPRGRVEVSTRREGDAVIISVDDSGPGIRAEQRELALQRFNRLGRTQAGGVGLGLSIVHSVAELHGAALLLADSPLGGLRVEVAFPQPPERAGGPAAGSVTP